MANIFNRSLLRSTQLSSSCSTAINSKFISRGFSTASHTPLYINNSSVAPTRAFNFQSRKNKSTTFNASEAKFNPFVTASDSNTSINPFQPVSVSSSSPSLSSVPVYPCVKSACERLFAAHGGDKKDRAFFVSDIGVVERQYNRWCNNLPNVKPFYAVKCNPDDMILKALASYGAGFDVASGEEMRAALRHGVSPSDIIFANPIKNMKDLKFAAKVGVKKMTFDNVDELYKIKQFAPDSELVLRLLPDDSGSIMRFGVKFGAPAENIDELLVTAKNLNLKVIGASFHVGSGCFDANTYYKAIQLCRQTFDRAEELGLPRFHFLDLGGGFPGNPVPNQMTGQVPAFESFASVIRCALTQFFPTSTHPDVQIIAEPGRYMATAWSTLFTYVQGKRLEPVDKLNPCGPRRILYYINDGVYGSFNCMMFDHATPQPIPAYRLMENKQSLENKINAAPQQQQQQQQMMANYFMAASSLAQAEVKYANARGIHSTIPSRDRDACLATFFGPTCDSMDCITKDMPLEELFVGEWVAFEQMGAYTNAAASTFNGMAKPIIHYVKSKHESPSIPSLG